MASKKSVKKAAVTVTLRRLARDFKSAAGEGKKGTIALVLDPRKFGDSAVGVNWLNGRTYADRAAALAAAKAAGATVAA